MSLPSEHPHETSTPPLAGDELPVLDGEFTSTQEEPTQLPVPTGPLRSQHSDSRGEAKRPSFWKRFKLRSRIAAPADSASVSDMTARLDAIEQAVEHFDTTLETQLEAVNARLEDVWESEEQDKKILRVVQLPLKLAYALTVHRSQGCSLDYAEIDLSNTFEYGMAYVALSRVKKLEGLSIIDINFDKIKANEKAIAFYKGLLEE